MKNTRKYIKFMFRYLAIAVLAAGFYLALKQPLSEVAGVVLTTFLVYTAIDL